MHSALLTLLEHDVQPLPKVEMHAMQPCGAFHKNCYKSAWVIRKYGVRLMPELYAHVNPMPFEAASQWKGSRLKI